MKNRMPLSKAPILLVDEQELLKYGEDVVKTMLSNPLVKMTSNEIGLYDLFKNNYLWYRSKWEKSLQELYNLGFTHQKSPAFFFKYVSKADVLFLRDTIDQTVAFLKNKNKQQRKEYVLLLDASVQHPNGKYYRFVHQSIVVESLADDDDWLVLCILSLIAVNHEYTKPLRMLRSTDNFKPCLFCAKGNEDTLCFTENEGELIQLIAQGWNTDEIADITSRSKYTINNNKANLKRKLNIYKMPQLISSAKIIGLG